MKWAVNLHNLLSDPDGVELYKQYLKTENGGELLDFWFACEGLKRLPSDQTEEMFQLIKVINRKYLSSKGVPIVEETRKTIQDKIGAKQEVNQRIFDAAQEEVEERMTRTYYDFLASEMYLNFIQALQTRGEGDQTGVGMNKEPAAVIGTKQGGQTRGKEEQLEEELGKEKEKRRGLQLELATSSLEVSILEKTMENMTQRDNKMNSDGLNEKFKMFNQGMMAGSGLAFGAAGTSVGPPRAPRPVPGLTQLKQVDKQQFEVGAGGGGKADQTGAGMTGIKQGGQTFSVKVGSLFQLESNWKYKV